MRRRTLDVDRRRSTLPAYAPHEWCFILFVVSFSHCLLLRFPNQPLTANLYACRLRLHLHLQIGGSNGPLDVLEHPLPMPRPRLFLKHAPLTRSSCRGTIIIRPRTSTTNCDFVRTAWRSLFN